MKTYVEFLYRVTSPSDEEFYAAKIFVPGNIYVISTRNGKWEAETMFKPEDLSSPIYRFNDWDVHRIDPSEAPARPKPDELPL